MLHNPFYVSNVVIVKLAAADEYNRFGAFLLSVRLFHFDSWTISGHFAVEALNNLLIIQRRLGQLSFGKKPGQSKYFIFKSTRRATYSRSATNYFFTFALRL